MSKPKIQVKSIDLTEVMDKLRGKNRKGADMLDALGDDIPDEVKEALTAIIDGVADAEGTGAGKKFTDALEAQAELLKFMAVPLPKQGSFVERNEFGKLRYKSPKDGVESAIVVEVFPTYVQEVEGHGVVNGIVAFCDRQGVVRSHMVDLRMYKEVEPVKVTGAAH